MHRILFFLVWLLVLILAQASLNPTIGLLAVLACAIHIGLVLGRRGQPHTTGVSLGAVLWLTRQVVTAPVRLPARLLRRRQPSQAETIDIEVYVADRAAACRRLLERSLRLPDSPAPRRVPNRGTHGGHTFRRLVCFWPL